MFRTALISALCAPSIALASTTTDFIDEIAGLFYIMIGLVLVSSLVIMGVGLLLWFLRLGRVREQPIRIMQWGVATLFTLTLALGVVEFVQTHMSATLYILSIAIIGLVLWALLTMSSGEENKDDKKGAH